ncbi:D-aminoacyl-tRNA deacylase [Kribbia dieselivorans]|uniref:D-aminoacyl-tRNA deacylase n=1 Tax=Kribbia dieselivorans TaxID=331526 RepID=UPI0008388F5D|nr:D-aminoacyl-tRNA deacylase [Kribbia dieselivorans]
MRAVVQRATSASVTVEGEVVGELGGPGLVVLLGVTHSDGDAEVAQMARKVAHLRILDGQRSAVDLGSPILLISQFTLYGDASKGRRPTWQAAAPREVAEPIVDAVGASLRQLGLDVETGRFGAQMAVALVNDGPFTVLLDV